MFNVPIELTPFIGRDSELSELAQLLTDPDCRLLTLVGPGGSGKTRLAIQAAQNNAAHYADGIYFVGLQPVSSSDFLLSSIADALHYTLHRSDDRQRLVDYLQNKTLLLILDNFEHLLEAAEILHHILIGAPTVKLMVTSREVLNLSEEWLYSVHGMRFPKDETDKDAPHYGAVRLFIEHARRMRHDFSFKDERIHVIKLCQIVEGLPLALELAASWLKSMPCSAIIREITGDPDFLNAPLRNLPVRHRSMRSVFEQSWKLLTEAEKQVFRRLSVFRGGFHHKAATEVTGASLHMLSVLLDKSLIRREPHGRYHMHELLCQYAAEQLRASPEDAVRTHELHCRYFAEFLSHRTDDIMGSRQVEIFHEITADLENIRAMWGYAIEHGNLDSLEQAVMAYPTFCDSQGRYQEALSALLKASYSLEPLGSLQARRILAILYTWQGWAYLRLGQYTDAETVLNRSHTLYQEMGLSPPKGFGAEPLNGLSQVAATQGNYEEALEFAERAYQQIILRDDKQDLTITLYALASAAFGQGNYETARRYAWQGYEVTCEVSNRIMMGYILVVLGNIERALKNYSQAREHYQASHDNEMKINDEEGVATAAVHLGRIAWIQRQYDEAANFFKESLEIYSHVYNPGGMGMTLHGLSDIALMTGDYPTACHYLCRALEIANNIHWSSLTLGVLISASELLEKIARSQRSVKLLKLVLAHPAADREMKERAQHSLTRMQRQFASQAPDELSPAHDETDIKTAALTLYTDLKMREKKLLARASQLSSHQFIEELSERELEILHLIANGLTNGQIAARLNLVLGTVKSHNHHIFDKLGVTNRVQALVRARALGLL